MDKNHAIIASQMRFIELNGGYDNEQNRNDSRDPG